MAEAKAQKKLPYAGAGAIDRFFAAVRTIRDPGRVDADWTSSNKVGEGIAIPSMLRFLGVLNEEYRPVSGQLWQDLRMPDTRQATLKGLVEAAYSDLFAALDVADATRDQIRVAFERIYNLGNANDRITTFFKLCELAGISLKALEAPAKKVTPSEPKATTTKTSTTREAKTPKATTPAVKPRVRPEQQLGTVGLTINLAVEIPAAWDEAQIKERVQAVARAAREIVDVDRT
jgi:hypothetical protein